MFVDQDSYFTKLAHRLGCSLPKFNEGEPVFDKEFGAGVVYQILRSKTDPGQWMYYVVMLDRRMAIWIREEYLTTLVKD